MNESKYIFTKAFDKPGYFVMLEDLFKAFAVYNEEYECMSFKPQLYLDNCKTEKEAKVKLKKLLKDREVMVIKEELKSAN